MPHEACTSCTSVCRGVCRGLGGACRGVGCVCGVWVCYVCVFALHTRFGIGMFSALLWRHTHGRTEALQTTVQRGLRALREAEGLKEVLVMSHIKYDFLDTEPRYFEGPNTSDISVYHLPESNSRIFHGFLKGSKLRRQQKYITRRTCSKNRSAVFQRARSLVTKLHKKPRRSSGQVQAEKVG